MDSNLTQVLSISAIGIGVVFIFLIIVIIASQFLTQIVKWINHSKQSEPIARKEIDVRTNHSIKIAAITSAIHRHRKRTYKLEIL